MAELKEYAPFLSVVAEDKDSNYLDHREGTAMVLVKTHSEAWWQIYIPDAGSINAAVSTARTLNEEANRKFQADIRQERDDEGKW